MCAGVALGTHVAPRFPSAELGHCRQRSSSFQWLRNVPLATSLCRQVSLFDAVEISSDVFPQCIVLLPAVFQPIRREKNGLALNPCGSDLHWFFAVIYWIQGFNSIKAFMCGTVFSKNVFLFEITSEHQRFLKSLCFMACILVGDARHHGISRSETSAHSRWITSFQGTHLLRGVSNSLKSRGIT